MFHTKRGSDFDGTFPDSMVTFVFDWGKTKDQQDYRMAESRSMSEEDKVQFENDCGFVVAD